MKRIRTLGDLRSFLDDFAEFPDDTPIFKPTSNGMEQRGLSEGILITKNLVDISKSEEIAWDAFDGESYTYTCYQKSEKESDIKGLVVY